MPDQILTVPGGSGGTPGGSATQVQFNNAGAFGGIAGATTDGTALSLVAPVLGTPASGTMTNTTGTPAGSLAGATLASNVLASSLTSVGTLTGGATGAGFTLALTASTVTGTLADARLSANVPLLNAANTFTNNQVVSGASFGLSGNITGSGIYSTTAGIRYKNTAGTLLDTTSNGTIASAQADMFGGNTWTASNATTITQAYGVYIKVPTAGSGITLTNPWALGADSARIGGTTISATGAISGASSIAATTSIQLGGASALFWGGRTNMQSPSDGVMTIWNNANTDFGRLQFGGTTSSFPALKRSAITLAVRLADDSADAPLTASNITLSGNLKLSGDTTGAGATAGFGTNSPATTLTAPYTWLKFISSDGSTVYVPSYK